MTYVVYSGQYPFSEALGTVEAPSDRPDIALEKAIQVFQYVDSHPVVQPISVN